MSLSRRNLIPDAILWHEGMLLRPEHFESMNARQEMLAQQAASAGPFAWGVDLLKLDAAALKLGRFLPAELDLQLPNGLGICWKATQEATPGLELPRPAGGQQQTLTIYAAVLPPDDDSGTTAGPRFEAVDPGDEPLRLDRNAPAESEDEEERIIIPRVRPRLELIAGQSRPASKYVAMPIARMRLRGGLWEVDESYMAPVQRVPESSALALECARTLAGVRKYGAYLAERWRNLSATERLQNPMDLLNLRTLSSALPVCDALLDSGSAHPFSLYLAFCALAGQMAGIAAEPRVPQFSPYDHDDLLKSFAEVRGFIDGVLAEGEVSDYLEVPMTPDATSFSTAFKKEWEGRRLILAARPVPGREAGAAAWVQSALIGATRLLRGMSETRVLGARRASITSEQGLPVDSKVLLFHIHEELRSDMRYILPGEPLEVSPGYGTRPADRPHEMTLYIRQEQPVEGEGGQRTP
jgi:type VI secretion system protein ImpJ